jgi:large subunit ribosomal protein L28
MASSLIGRLSSLSFRVWKPTAVVAAVGINMVSALDNFLGQIRYRSNRSRRGLYDGRDIRSGNYVSFSHRKTPRKFRPNVFKKRVYSETLDEMIRFHVTAGALRSIDKAGGLDNYLMTSRHVEEGEGLKVKRRIMQKRRYLAYLERVKAAGTGTEGLTTIDEQDEENQESV